MGHAATLFVYYVSIFRGFRKFILGVIKKWSSEAALTFQADFLSVTLPVMAIKPRLFYQVVKNLGQPRPISYCTEFSYT